ncbi:MAG: hypothetical protein AAF501_21800 [Pseudomonadota bacterium]
MSKDPPEDTPDKKAVGKGPQELDSSDIDFAVGAGFGSAFLSKRPWDGTEDKDADWEVDETDLNDL